MENEKDLQMEVEYFTVQGKEFYLPNEVDYIQWKYIKKVMSKADIKLKDLAELNHDTKKIALGGTVSKTLDTLTEKDLIPTFFAIVLIPKGAEYWEEKYLENKQLMERIGDKTMVEVAVRFLSGRESLVLTITNFFTNFLKDFTAQGKK